MNGAGKTNVTNNRIYRKICEWRDITILTLNFLHGHSTCTYVCVVTYEIETLHK